MEYAKRLTKVAALSRQLTQKLPYHNYRHELDVCRAVGILADAEKVREHDKFLLRSAALLHDVIVEQGREDNEERSAMLAYSYLIRPEYRYSSQEAGKVAELIEDTKLSREPRSLLGQIIQDADLSHLGSKNEFEIMEHLCQEWGIQAGRAWHKHQAEFLESHNYHTKSAKQLWDEGKRTNLKNCKRFMEGKIHAP